MIPLRISLQGFLCYRTKAEICFDDSSLWMLAGLNGSGKSAVFDAVTYALFGGHRGGVRNAEELVNKESDGLLVEFDFLCGSETYRIKRTLKKQGRSTRQVLQREHASEGGERWEPLESTSNQRGFEEWVRAHIGLNYETFTSSVLLMQGKAEKLLNSDAGDRRKVLAGIVDLERYEKLHRKADDRRKNLKDRAEVLHQKLDLFAEVTEAELAGAEEGIAAGQEALEQAQVELERRQRLKLQGEHWADLRQKLEQATRQWEQIQRLLARAEIIERDWSRLRLLREVLPQLDTIWQQRGRLSQSQNTITLLTEERGSLAEQLATTDYAEKQAREKRIVLEQAIADDQQQEQEVNRRLVELSGVLARVAFCERQRQNVMALEGRLAELPADPGAVLWEAREACDRLAALRQALPFLERLHEERAGLSDARERVRRLTEEEQALTAEGSQLAVELRTLQPQVEEAAAKRRQSEEAAAGARALLQEANKQLAELDQLQGTKVCRHCGQPLTPKHLADERARRQLARAQAEVAHRQSDEDRKRALGEEKRLQQEHHEKDEHIRQLREQHRDSRSRRQQAEQDVERHLRECERTHGELPETHRYQVAGTPPADWLATTFPAAAELDDMRRQCQGLEAAKKRVQLAQTAVEQWSKLQAECAGARRTLADQEAGLPSDVAALRRQHDELHTSDAALKTRLREQRARLQDEQANQERLSTQRAHFCQQVADRDHRSDVERVRQEAARENMSRALAALPLNWREEAEQLTNPHLQELNTERTALEGMGAEAQARELQQARERLEALRQEKANRERDLDVIPEEARREPAVLEEQLGQARREQRLREEVLSEARSARKALTDREEQRQRLNEEFLTVDQMYNRYRLLADLLGPKRLQLYLVRQAERGIVDYANEALDRLSGGQLYLRLRGEDNEESADKALDLEAYNRTAGVAPIGVAFLSGSQRFRVAVSLALGIGQYASHQHRPIESVIIDEGFGCLDRQGRQVMIQELQNLRDNMRCILLVSHQEEFAEAFANGYRFELNNGTTEVTRFQR